MEMALFGYVLVTLAGIGGAGLATAGELPVDDFTPTPVPKGPFGICRICPIILGGLLALLLWFLGGPPRPDEVLVGAPLVGLAAGSAGATLYRVLAPRRRPVSV